MKKSVILLAVFFLLFSIIIVSANSGPFVKLDKYSINLGYIPQMAEFERQIIIKSNYDSTFVLGKINTYCECIEAKLDKTVLRPGDSIGLRLKLSTGKLIGKLYKVAHIYDEDGSRLAKVTITASIYDSTAVFKTISVEPPYINFSQFGNKGPERIEFSIKNITEETVPLELLYSDTGFFKLDVPLFIDPNSVAKGVVELTDGGKNTEFTGFFTFEYIDANSQKFTFSIPVKRKIFK